MEDYQEAALSELLAVRSPTLINYIILLNKIKRISTGITEQQRITNKCLSIFQDSLKHVLKTFGKPIDIVEFDWITALRTSGLHRSVEALWSEVKDAMKDFGYSCGSYYRGKMTSTYVELPTFLCNI